MEIKKHDYYNEKATISVEFKEHAKRSLITLDSVLNQINTDMPDSVGTYAENLRAQLEKVTKDAPSVDIEDEFKILNDYPKILQKSKDTLLSFMNDPKYHSLPITEKIEIEVLDFLRSFLYFRYYIAISLTAIMSREEAIKYFRNIVDIRTHQTRDLVGQVDNLNDLIDDLSFFEKYQAHDIINYKINNGKMGTKITKCMWFEVLKELNDPEFSYSVACHYDFEATKVMNPQFILTRDKTLMQGAEYCDFCYHDKRIISEVVHPSEEFWDNLK